MTPRATDHNPDLMSFLRRHRAGIALFAITLAGLFLRFFRLRSTPPGLFFDEGMYGFDAAEAMRTGHYAVFYPANYGREGLYINLQCISLALFHLHTGWVLRLQSAVEGTLTIPGLFLLALEIARFPGSPNRPRAVYSRRPILFASASTAFLALCLWQVLLSRVGFSAILAPLVFVWCSYALLRAIRETEEPTHTTPFGKEWIAAGFLFGLGFYTYLPFRVAPLIFAVFAPILLSRQIRLRALAAVLVAIVTALPLVHYFCVHPGSVSSRTGVLTVWNTAHPGYEFTYNLLVASTMFYYHGDSNWRHNVGGQPELWLPVAVLFGFGLLYLLQRRSIVDVWLIVWLAAGTLPMVLARTGEGMPHALRSILIAPAACIVAGIGTCWLYDQVSAKGSRARRAAQWAIAALVAANFVFTYWLYFHDYARSQHVINAFYVRELADKADALNALPLTETKYVVVNNWPGGGIRDMSVRTQSFFFEVYVTRLTDAPPRHIVIVNALDKAAVARIPAAAPRYDVE